MIVNGTMRHNYSFVHIGLFSFRSKFPQKPRRAQKENAPEEFISCFFGQHKCIQYPMRTIDPFNRAQDNA